ncbi:MAG: hypothetical protein EBU46_20215 [Nitrosomonadaceae bacterium]|nr:hypothetical protein [Nitrosomonadaceae bacterium]
MNKTFNLLLGIFFLIAPRMILAHEGHDHGPSLAISVAIDGQGNLWRASVKDGFVIVDKASDHLPLVFSIRLESIAYITDTPEAANVIA